MPQTSFDQLLIQRMRENKSVDFLYPGSKRSIITGAKIKYISLELESARIEFLNSGEPENIAVPLNNIYIPGN